MILQALQQCRERSTVLQFAQSGRVGELTLTAK